jgi:hypothetical protein
MSRTDMKTITIKLEIDKRTNRPKMKGFCLVNGRECEYEIEGNGTEFWHLPVTGESLKILSSEVHEGLPNYFVLTCAEKPISVQTVEG